MGSNHVCCKREKVEEKKPEQVKEKPTIEKKENVINLPVIQLKSSSKHIRIETSSQKNSNDCSSDNILKNMDIKDLNDKSILRELIKCLKEALSFNSNNKDIKESIFVFLTEDCIFYNERENYFYTVFKSKDDFHLDNQWNFKEYTKSLKTDDDSLLQINPKIVSLSTSLFKEKEILELDGSEYFICHSIGMLYLKYVKKIKKDKLIKLNKKVAKNDIPDIDNLDMQEYLFIHLCFMDISNSEIEDTESKLSLILSKYNN